MNSIDLPGPSGDFQIIDQFESTYADREGFLNKVSSEEDDKPIPSMIMDIITRNTALLPIVFKYKHNPVSLGPDLDGKHSFSGNRF